MYRFVPDHVRRLMVAGALALAAAVLIPGVAAASPVTPTVKAQTAPLAVAISTGTPTATVLPGRTQRLAVAPKRAHLARATPPVVPRGDQVVAAVARQAGKPYSYGASGPGSFDCSGLTRYVYAQFGVALPHSANAQRGYGRVIGWADARPGDLIIFLSGGYGYHAGIYAGGNRMWDAPTDGQVVGEHTIWSHTVAIRRLV